MKENLNLEINNVRSIKNANIEINKLNVIGGVNGSGKSTVSKIFYSFLKANSQDRKSYLHQEMIEVINKRIEFLKDKKIDVDNLPNSLTSDDDYSAVIEKYGKVINISKSYEEINDKNRDEASEKILNIYGVLIDKFEEKGVDVDNLKGIDSVNDIFHKDNYPIIKRLAKENDLDEFFELRRLHSQYSEARSFQMFIESIENPCKLIDSYFKKNDNPKLSELIMRIVLVKEYFRELNKSWESKINFHLNNENAFDYFFENEFINQVFYIDNVSILDFEELNSEFMPLHKSELIDVLYKNDLESFSKKKELVDDDVNNILSKIEKIIQGEYFFEGHLFNTKIPFDRESGHISFQTKDGEPTIAVMGDNISSGIKQIGILQILLLNDKLKKDSYLILDEPEVNLHPKWQFKFAEILVLLAKELNITLYINSHSPMFIESLDAFCEYYDMEDEINYYLTEKSDEEFKYDFTKINSKELYKIYDNLGSPYKLINQLKLRKKFNK